MTALTFAGCGDEARAAANGLIDTAEATHNPWALSQALFAYGTAFRDADPVRARDALRRGLVIAQNSGNRAYESLLGLSLSHLEAESGDPLAALDYFMPVIRNFHDSGSTASSLARWLSSPPCSTGSDATNRRPPSPASPSAPSRARPPPKSTPRSPTYAVSSATRPTNRSPARVRR